MEDDWKNVWKGTMDGGMSAEQGEAEEFNVDGFNQRGRRGAAQG